MYYKLGQLCFITNQEQSCCKLAGASLLQIGANVVTNWGTITNQGNRYYK